MRLQGSSAWDYGYRSHRVYRRGQDIYVCFFFLWRKANCEAPCALGLCMVLSYPCLPFIKKVKGLSLVFKIFLHFLPLVYIVPNLPLCPLWAFLFLFLIFSWPLCNFQEGIMYFWQVAILASFTLDKNKHPKSVTPTSKYGVHTFVSSEFNWFSYKK